MDTLLKLILAILITIAFLFLKISMSNFQKVKTGKSDLEVKNTKKHNIATGILFFVLVCMNIIF